MLNYNTNPSSTESYAIRKLNKRVDRVEECNSLQTQCENCLQYQIECNECCTNERIERIEEALCHCECWICVCTMCANVEDVTVCGDTCICGPMRMYCGEVQCDVTMKDNLCVEGSLNVAGNIGTAGISACTVSVCDLSVGTVHGDLSVECNLSSGGCVSVYGDITTGGDITTCGGITSCLDITTCGDIHTAQGNIKFSYCASTETIIIG